VAIYYTGYMHFFNVPENKIGAYIRKKEITTSFSNVRKYGFKLLAYTNS